LKLTIEQAVEIGLKNSKPLGLATEAVERARGRVSEQRAGFNPSLGATATFTRLDQGSTVTFPDQNGNPTTIPIVRQNQKALQLQGNLPIDLFGLIRTAVQQQQFLEIAARLDVNRTRNQTVLDIKNAYYDVLRAKAFVGVADQTLSNAKDRLRIAEVTLRNGTGTRFDVLRAETEVANAQQGVIVAKNRVNLTTATLNNVLGLDQNTPTDTTEAVEMSEPAKDFNSAVSEAYQKRPEIVEGDANIRAAQKGITLARRSTMPTVGAGVNFQYQPDAGGFAPKTTSWAAVATLTVPIFEQGLARARERQARSDVRSAEINKQATQDTVALEVRQAFLALAEAQDRLAVTTAALTQAQEQYRLAKVRFEEGVTAVPGASPLLEIGDAQSALTQAQNNKVSAQYDVQNSRARLDRAIGRYAYDGSAQPGLPAPPPGGKK
jgi:outer membrane protein